MPGDNLIFNFYIFYRLLWALQWLSGYVSILLPSSSSIPFYLAFIMMFGLSCGFPCLRNDKSLRFRGPKLYSQPTDSCTSVRGLAPSQSRTFGLPSASDLSGLYLSSTVYSSHCGRARLVCVSELLNGTG